MAMLRIFRTKRRDKVDEHGFDFTAWADNLASENWDAVSQQLEGIIVEETQPKKPSRGADEERG